jgi:Cdc6-like AAA superfamily ATPase
MLNLAIDIVETVDEAEKLRKPLDVREHAARLARRHSGEQVTRSEIADSIRQETDHSAASILKPREETNQSSPDADCLRKI